MAKEYQAYLLRLQRNNAGDPWRALLQNAHTGEKLRFANEREMLKYLIHILTTDRLENIDVKGL